MSEPTTPCVGISVTVVRRGKDHPEILFLRRSGGRFAGQWWPVTGTREPGEDPVACALRELSEETALFPAGLYETGFRPPIEGGRGHLRVFVATVDAGAPVRLNWEHDDLQWCSLDEARARVPDPSIRSFDEAVRILEEEPDEQRIDLSPYGGAE